MPRSRQLNCRSDSPSDPWQTVPLLRIELQNTPSLLENWRDDLERWPAGDGHIILQLGIPSERIPGVLEALAQVAAADQAQDVLAGHLKVTGQPSASSTSRAESLKPEHESPVARYEFRRKGEYWTICYRGPSNCLRHSLGLTYIAWLLAAPYEEFHSLDLAAAARGRSRQPGRLDHELGLVASTGQGLGPALTAQTKREYRAHVHDLEQEIGEARENCDFSRVELLRAELELILSEIEHGQGLGGGDRQQRSASESARSAVTQAIVSARRRIAKCDSALAEHLNAHLYTGTYCSYSPPQRLSWRF